MGVLGTHRNARPDAAVDPASEPMMASGPDDEPRRLRAEVVRQYARGRYSEAADAARALVSWQGQAVGERHPDYARALASLALLLAKVGDQAEAARLMGEAVAIRREVLGAAHPETIEAESHLAALESPSAGVSAPRGPGRNVFRPQRPGADRPLAEPESSETTDDDTSAPAAAYRRPVVPATPLVVLADAGAGAGWTPAGARNGSNGVGTHGSPSPGASASAAGASFAGTLVSLSERLARVGSALSAVGRLPSAEQFEELNACRAQLDTVCRRLARALGREDGGRAPAEPRPTIPVPPPAPAPAAAPAAVIAPPHVAVRRPPTMPGPNRAAVPPRPEPTTPPRNVAPAEPPPVRLVEPVPIPDRSPPPRRTSERPVSAPAAIAGHAAAQALLDRVLRLTMIGSGDPGLLIPCLAAAEKLRATLASHPASVPGGVVDGLATGQHPFASLLALVERREAMTDSVWASHHESITQAFGKPLALAVSRGRVRPLS